MKKLVMAGFVVILASCNNSATVTIGNDTVGRKVDTLGDKVENKAERLYIKIITI